MVRRLRAIRTELMDRVESGQGSGLQEIAVADLDRWREDIDQTLRRLAVLEEAAGSAVAAYLLRSSGADPDSVPPGGRSVAGRKELIKRIGTAMAELERALRAMSED